MHPMLLRPIYHPLLFVKQQTFHVFPVSWNSSKLEKPRLSPGDMICFPKITQRLGSIFQICLSSYIPIL